MTVKKVCQPWPLDSLETHSYMEAAAELRNSSGPKRGVIVWRGGRREGGRPTFLDISCTKP